MENILEIKDIEEYDYSNIKLSNPTIQTGNNYYTTITIGERDKPFYIQFPKCTTKAGYVKNNSKCYTDLVFFASDTKIIKWLENFETYLQNEIYKKRDLWFDTEISLDDIQELMTPLMRSYKSGKNILVRCNIKNHKCSVYDENEILLDLDNFTNDKDIIPLVSVNGIKFSSRSFVIELNLSQIMIISSKDDLEKNCLIKSSRVNKKHLVDSNSLDKNEIKEGKNSLEKSTNIDTDKPITLEDKEDLEDNDLQDDIEEIEKKEESLDSQVSEKIDENENTKEILEIVDSLDNVEENIASDESKTTNILLDISDKDINKPVEENKDIKENDNMNVLDEVDLDSIELINNKENNSEINIKEPQEIYYEIYKNALQKANALKKNTIEAFLNAKNIKVKYNLEDLDLNLEDNYDEEIEELNNLN